MRRLTHLAAERPLLLWSGLLLLALGAGWLTAELVSGSRIDERRQQLQLDVERRTVALMSETLNGSMMGAVAVLGLIDPAIKREALGELPANSPSVLPTLESIGRSYDTDGVFVVDRNGIIASSWDNAGKPSTKLNVKFRPYYQMAMQGMGNVYAAVSLARGDRSLYFSAPVFADTTNATDAIGAVVARTSLLRVDALLRDSADLALLLSPQGVVFASNRSEWIGHLSGTPSPERLQAIRDLKQFGRLFDSRTPPVLPLDVDAGLHEFEGNTWAVAHAMLAWNDPFGDWSLVLAENVDHSVSPLRGWLAGGFVALSLLLTGTLLLGVLRGQHRQRQAAHQIEIFAREQAETARRKERLSAVGVRMQRSSDEAELIAAFLNECHQLVGMAQGVVYRADGDADAPLRLIGSFACDPTPAELLAPGEGLLGQCARERRESVLALGAGRMTLRSGLGSTPAVATLLAPVLLHERLLGVAELAFARSIDATMRETLDELLALLAMNLEILARARETRQLLDATVAAEHLAADQLAFQRILLDTIPYPVFYKGADSRYLGVNRAYEAAFGVCREDLIGKRVIDLEHIPLEERLSSQREEEAIIAAGTQVERECAIPFADGKVHEGIHFAAGIVRADGTRGGLVGIFIDITTIKEAERALARLADVERFNRIARGREQRILELKQEVNALAEQLGRDPIYESAAIAQLQAEAEAFAAEMGTAAPGSLEEASDPESVRRLFESLQQQRLAALSLAEDAEAARRALAADRGVAP